MKLLAISDEVVPWIYSAGLIQRFADVDMVVSCGDLPLHYLEFIASSLNAPYLYVKGNHDLYEIHEDGNHPYDPQGWLDLNLHRVSIHGLILAGLGGCLRYKPHAPMQYTQSEQWVRAIWLARTMLPRYIAGDRAVDVLVTHAPPYGIHDGPDQAHLGFHAYNWLIKVFKPRLLLHGHQHSNYAPLRPVETVIDGTRILNVHPYRVIEL